MRSETLLTRLALCATAFLVFSMHHQFSTLNNRNTNDPLQTGRSAAGLLDNDVAHGYLRSIATKEDKLLERIEEMGVELKEMKKFTHQLQEQQQQQQQQQQNIINNNSQQDRVLTTATDNAQSNNLPLPASAISRAVQNGPCDQLRSSTTSMTFLVPYAGECKKRSLLEVAQPPKPLSIATVIPGLAREKDIEFFPKVLKSLEEQTVPSDEIVIALSGVFDRVGVRYKHKMHNDFSTFELKKATKFCDSTLETFQKHVTKSPIKLVCIGERLSSGRARNAAIAAVSSDILAFIDSDDTAYPIRNEVVRNVFDETKSCRKVEGKPTPPLQLLLHSHKRNEKKPHPYEKARGYGLPPTNKVLPKAWTGEECVEYEDGLELQHGRKLLASMAGRPSSWKIADEVANGHPVIRRSAFDKVHFSSIPKGQDIILLRDLMYTMSPQEAEQAVLFMNRPLTTYYAAGNANSDLRNAKQEDKEKAQNAQAKKKDIAKKEENNNNNSKEASETAAKNEDNATPSNQKVDEEKKDRNKEEKKEEDKGTRKKTVTREKKRN